MATYLHLSDGRPDGALLGQSASDKVGFHGATPVIQTTYVATLTGAALSVSGVVGFTSSTSVSQLVALVNQMAACLQNHGLMAAS